MCLFIYFKIVEHLKYKLIKNNVQPTQLIFKIYTRRFLLEEHVMVLINDECFFYKSVGIAFI
jgi:hypothetical protein